MAYKDKENQAKAARKHYLLNKEKLIIRAKLHKKNKIASLYDTINKLKNQPCADCGIIYHPCMMDYDHISDNKDRSVSTLIRDGVSLQRVLKK